MLLRLVYTTWPEAVRAIVTQLQAFDQANTAAIDLKANIASPTLTGTPAAPTAAAATNTTQLATTAFVTTADNLKAEIAGSASQSFSMLNGTVAGTLATGSATVTGGITAQGATGMISVKNRAGTAIQYTFYDPNGDGLQLDISGLGTVLTVSKTGTLSLTGASSTLGYGTGAGGTVTQATDKSTAVTLHKSCGQITMNNAALAASTSISFTLTNSLIGVADSVIASIKDAISSNITYQLTVSAMGAGFCIFHLRNVSAGSLSEALVINFAVIKGATA